MPQTISTKIIGPARLIVDLHVLFVYHALRKLSKTPPGAVVPCCGLGEVNCVALRKAVKSEQSSMSGAKLSPVRSRWSSRQTSRGGCGSKTDRSLIKTNNKTE